MKIESINKEVQEKVMQLLNDAPAEKKAEAIMQSIEMIQEAAHEDLVNQVVAEAERASHDADFKKQLGLRNLSQEEKKFYEGFKDIKQSITANQIDIIPTEIIDRTLDDVKKASPILNLVNMAPANVKKWIVASHTGAAVWGALTDSVKGELSTEISALNIDLHMLTAYLVIPKAIRELSLEFVDRYFMAILSEAMQDGLVKGYLDGDGKTGPIGIFRQIGTSNSDGTNKAKTVVTNITKFSPTGTFADMLNWAGTSEDAFNEKLAACGSESERVNLVMQEMANQGLVDAGKKWQENNKNLVDGNKATADFQQATAELADTVAPLITKITELVAGLIEEFNQLSPEGQRLIAGCVLVVAAVGPVFSIISKVAGGVSSLIGIISKIAPVLGPIKTGFAAVNAVMAANPILIIIAAVAALIAIFVTLYNKCEWFRDGVNAIFGAVADFIKGAIDKIKGFFDFDWKLPKIKLPHFKASGEWSLSPLKVPKFSVDWYANGGILNSPTIFGANGDSLMGGGEAGKEAVLPIKLLKDYIREENDANNATLAAMIVEAFKSISMTAENNIYIGDKKSITLLTNLVLKQMATIIYPGGGECS